MLQLRKIRLSRGIIRVLFYLCAVTLTIAGFVGLGFYRGVFSKYVPVLLDTLTVDTALADVRFRTCYSAFGWVPRCSPYSSTKGWVRIPKDLLLGRRWYQRLYMEYKVVSPSDDVRVINGIQVRQRGSADKLAGYTDTGYGVWLKKGPYSAEESVSGLDVLFGRMAVDPRVGWDVIKTPLWVEEGDDNSEGIAQQPSEESEFKRDFHVYDKENYLSVRHGKTAKNERRDKDGNVVATPAFHPTLRFHEDGKFKILQLADMHLVAGFGRCRDPYPDVEDTAKCLADWRTLHFVNQVLDLEHPDLVIMTGDQVFGSESKDYETALFKAAQPLVDRVIPYAMVMGNHDPEGSLTREQIYNILQTLPYSLSAAGPADVSGVGNYHLVVKDGEGKNGLAMYFLDSHSYSRSKVPGYDYLKEDQKVFVKEEHDKVGQASLSMAFFHIPLPEYRELFDGSQRPIVGQSKEYCTAPMHNSHMYDVFKEIGVSVVSVGHDHCNDYCLNYNGMQLCYGGAAGEGGYAGYGGTTRRMRIFEIDNQKGSITTWKRLQTKPDETFDEQILYQK